MAIIDIQRRLHEAGRIRIGQQVATNNGRTRPAKLDRFRFTSSDEQSLRALAGVYGGTVQPWENAPAGEAFELFSEAKEIAVLVPPEHMSYSQFYELWSGGGCQRRCDGQRESLSDSPCPCDPENRECKPHTRLSVMLTAVPGTGLWRLDTQGYYAAVELGGTLELANLVAGASGRAILPGRLRLDQRSVKRPNQATRQFAVPVLDLDVDMQALGSGAGQTVDYERPVLTPVPNDSRPVPSLAEQLHSVDEPQPKAHRANAAEPVRRTGLGPRPAADRNGEIIVAASTEQATSKVKTKELNKIRSLLNKAGVRDGAEVLAKVVTLAERAMTDIGELTQDEALRVIVALTAPESPGYDVARTQLLPGEEPF